MRRKIGTVEEEHSFVYAVLGEGDFFFLALTITVHKAWGDGATDTLRTVFADEYVERLNRIIEIGKENVKGTDINGLKSRQCRHLQKREAINWN